MLSQVKRKRNLLLALTLMVLFTGSILAFSIQAAYSTEELFGAYNFLLSGSNAQTAIEQVQEELKGIQDDARIEGDETLAISIDNVVIKLDVAKKGLAEMDKFFFVMSDELHSLKQGLNSVGNEVAVESIPQTTESAAKKGAYSNITLERSGFANGFVVLDDLQNVAPILSKSLCSGKVEESCETLFNDSWVIVISKSMLGDTTSDELGEYLKVTLLDAQTTSTKISSQDDFELTKAAVVPGLQPEDIKPKVPNWIKNNAGWYAEGLITEDDFVVGLKWMINNGVIEIQNQEEIVK